MSLIYLEQLRDLHHSLGEPDPSPDKYENGDLSLLEILDQWVSSRKITPGSNILDTMDKLYRIAYRERTQADT